MCRQCRPSPPSSARVRIRRSSGLCSDPKLWQTNRLQSTAVFAAMSTSKVEVGRFRRVSKGPCFCNAAPMPRDPGPRRPPVSSQPKQKIIYPRQLPGLTGSAWTSDLELSARRHSQLLALRLHRQVSSQSTRKGSRLETSIALGDTGNAACVDLSASGGPKTAGRWATECRN